MARRKTLPATGTSLPSVIPACPSTSAPACASSGPRPLATEKFYSQAGFVRLLPEFRTCFPPLPLWMAWGYTVLPLTMLAFSPRNNRVGKAETPATLRQGAAWLQAAVGVIVGRRRREIGRRPKGECAPES